VPVAELAQDVSLAPVVKLVRDGRLELAFRGAVRSYAQRNPDSAQVVLEFRDYGNRRVLERWGSGPVENQGAWKVLTDTRTVPKDARWVRVRLVSVRSAGVENDGYFDNLSLIATAKD
jgi:hypothetical protein